MWTSPETFESDLFAFSEIEGVRDPVVTTTPQSLIEWEARNGVNEERSVFDSINFVDDVTYVVSGRGRGGISTIIRPGAAPRVAANVDQDIKKKLREVTGAGFSNELIEQTYRNNTITGIKPDDKLKQTVPVNFDRSNGSISNTTSRVHTPVTSSEQSRNQSPNKSPSASSRCSSRISISSESETKGVIEEVTPNLVPVPLSALLKQAKDIRNLRKIKEKALEKPQEVDEKKENEEEDIEQFKEVKENIEVNDNDSWWRNGTSSDSGGENTNYSWRQRDIPMPNRYFNDCFKDKNCSKYFNISSPDEFPALK